jgi:hypothetical protein
MYKDDDAALDLRLHRLIRVIQDDGAARGGEGGSVARACNIELKMCDRRN